jgi:hypothetical protein
MPDQRPKTSKGMEGKYRAWSTQRRYTEAMRLVLEEHMPQAEAARRCGISRPRLNEKIAERRKQLAELQQRSAEARAARTEAFDAQAETQDLESLEEDPSPVEPPAPDTGAAGAPDEAPALPLGPLGLNERRRVPSPVEFIERYFGNVVCPDCDVHHDVPEFHKQIISKSTDPAVRRLLVNVAPYHAKSTIVTVYGTIYELVRDPNSRHAIISKAGDLGEAFLYQISKLLTDPDVYIGAAGNLVDEWGPFHNPQNWTKQQIYIAGRMSAQKDPSISVYGYGKQIYGRRFDRMVFDDLADLENQRNPNLVDQMLAKTTQEYASRVGKTGQLIFVGTRVSPGDLYSKLTKLPAYEVLRFPCILDEDEQTTLWPEHFPFRSAAEQRDSMSMEQFQLVYQNIDTPGLGASFPPDVVEAAHDPERTIGDVPEGNIRLVLGVDPAGANSQAGYTAMVVLAIDITTGRRYLVDLVNHKQMKAPQIKDQMLAFAEQYQLTEVRVEVNGLQSQLFQYDQDLISKLTMKGVRVAPHITTGRNKWDPQFGVESMAPLFYNRQVSIPWRDISAREKFRHLCEQLMAFPLGAQQDLTMAFWFAELGAREVYQRTNVPMFDSRMKVPPRIMRNRRVVDFGNRQVRHPTELELAGGMYGPAQQPQTVQLANRDASVTVY